MIKKRHIQSLLCFCAAAALFCSCTIEHREPDTTTYLYVANGISTMTRSFPGYEDLDNEISTLRILGFDAAGTCASNQIYDAGLYDVIKHEIAPGTYDLVFIANEPESLDGINNYTELQNITFDGDMINSEYLIPMAQEIKNVEILPMSHGARINGGSPDYHEYIVYQPLQLHLSRLAVRVDVVLLSNEVKSISKIEFTNIPMTVSPLSFKNDDVFRGYYRTFDFLNGVVELNEEEIQAMIDDGMIDLTAFDKNQGDVIWAVKLPRVILPFNNFDDPTDQSRAISLSVSISSPPSGCLLQSGDNNYTLPRDTAVLLIGWIKRTIINVR